MKVYGFLVLAAGMLCLAATAGQKKSDTARDILLEKELMGVSVGGLVGGPKVTSDDLPGRVVLFVFSGPGDAKWNEFMSRMVNQYANAAPPGGIITIFAMDNKNAKDNKWWLDVKGNASVSFAKGEEFAMPGFFFSGLPRFILFDADGKMVGDICHDGRDMSGNSVHTYAGERFSPDSIRKIADISGSVLKTSTYKECADDAQRLIEAAVNSAPLSQILSSLRSKVTSGKNGVKSEAAQILAEFKEYVSKQALLIDRNAATNPLLSMRALKRMITQLAGDKELMPPFEKLQKQFKDNTRFQDELKAAEALCNVRMLAASIAWGLKDPDFPQRPKEKVAAIRKGLQDIIAKFPRSNAAQTAEELNVAYSAWVGKAINPQAW
jgi:hypothetical protein